MDKKDAQYLRQMGEADLAEVQSGKLAQQKASSAEVKKFAEHMVEEHGKGMKEGESLAKAKGRQAPSSPDRKHQAAMKKLESQSGAQFDRAYMRQMVKDHQDVLKTLQKAAKDAKDPDIKAAAEKKAREVAQHLDMAKSTLASVDGGGKSGAGGSARGKKQ
jgi:putative membrane protein